MSGNTNSRRGQIVTGRRACGCRVGSTFGFTLVELLVVIGIIGVLLAILLPALSKARQQANNVKCQANLKQIGTAMQIYIDNSGGVLPYGYWNGVFNLTTNNDYASGNYWTDFDPTKAGDWTMLLQGAMSSKYIPTYAGLGVNNNGMPALGAADSSRLIFTCPEAPDTSLNQYIPISHYACHPRLMPVWGGLPDFYRNGGSTGPFLQPYKASQIKRASEIVLVFDSTLAPVTSGGFTVPMSSGLGNSAGLSQSYGYSRDPLTFSNLVPSGSPAQTSTGFSLPVALEMDRERIYNSGGGGSQFGTWMTDNYGLIPAALNNGPNSPGMFPNNSVDLTPPNPQSNVNKDAFGPRYNGTVGGYNLRTLRFRHLNNASGNFLYVDGHVESLRWGGAIDSGASATSQLNDISAGDLKRANINVNP